MRLGWKSIKYEILTDTNDILHFNIVTEQHFLSAWRNTHSLGNILYITGVTEGEIFFFY